MAKPLFSLVLGLADFSGLKHTNKKEKPGGSACSQSTGLDGGQKRLCRQGTQAGEVSPALRKKQKIASIWSRWLHSYPALQQVVRAFRQMPSMSGTLRLDLSHPKFKSIFQSQ